MLNNLSIRHKLAAMVVLPIAVAIILASALVIERWRAHRELSVLQNRLELLASTDRLLGALRAERGLGPSWSRADDARIDEQYQATESAVDKQLALVGTRYATVRDNLDEKLRLRFSAWLDKGRILTASRAEKGALDQEESRERVLSFTALILAGDNLIQDASYAGSSQDISRFQRAVDLLRALQEQLGNERRELLLMLQNGESEGVALAEVKRSQSARAVHLTELREIADFQRYYGSQLDSALQIEERTIAAVRTGLNSHLLKLELLRTMNGLIGYVGLIHHFKNFLLRGEPAYETGFEEKYEQVVALAGRMAALPSLTSVQRTAAQQVVDVFTAYGGQFEVIRTMRETGMPLESIDTLVGIDDSVAEAALQELRMFRSNVRPYLWWLASTARVDGLGAIQNEVYARMGRLAGEQADRALMTLFGTVLFVLALVGVVGVLAMSTYRRLIGGIGDTVTAMRSLAETGDLDTPLPVGEQADEIGQLVEAARRIVAALRSLVQQAEAAGAGDFSTDVEQRSDQDALAISFNRMIENTRELLERAESIAGGQHDVQIDLRGDNDQLGQTLLRMASSLRSFSEQVATDQWLKNGQVELAQIASGELNIDELAAGVAPFLTQYVGGRAAAFYVMDPDGAKLRMRGAYAYSDLTPAGRSFAPDEGLVGACASEGELQYIKNLPVDYMQIGSGLGSRVPGSLLLMPIMENDKCLGVLETAFFGKPQPKVLDFMPLAAEVMAGALQRAWARTRLDQLLAETRAQAQKLLSSEEELRAQSEELRASNEELEEKTRALEDQASVLRQNEEKLQTQSEELQAANEELTERSRLQELYNKELQERAEEIARANQYKSEFLANMSHELRTPLNSMLILSKMLADNEEGNLSEDQIESAQVVHESGNNLLNLINDILDLSKVESGKVELHFEQHKLRAMVNNLGKRYRPLAEQRGLQFDVEVNDDVPEELVTDGMRLEQVVTNLLSNAFKFTHEGSVTLLIEMVQGKLPGGDAVAFRVRDTGIGIPDNKLDKVFRAFEQADGSTTRKYGGTGLGLAISRQMAQHLGGEMDVVSVEGTGSTFSIYLPLEPDVGAAGISDAVADLEAVASDFANETVAETPGVSEGLQVLDDRDSIEHGDRCVVIIEDEPGFARVLLRTARDRGLKAVVAHDAASGVELVRRFRPIGVLLDIGLPGADGWSVMAELKSNDETRHIPVHFLSGEDQTERALSEGAIGFATKPVSREDASNLLGGLEAMLEDAQRRVLVLEADDQDRALIRKELSSESVDVVEAAEVDAALQRLENETFNCVVLNCHQQGAIARQFLQQAGERGVQLPPVIVHTEDALSEAQQAELSSCYQNSLILKNAHTGDRLLDEVTLFLHHVRGRTLAPEPRIDEVLQDDNCLHEKTVLLVDDDMRNVFALAKILRTKGMNVLKAQDGKRALKQMEEHAEGIDLVLMDIMMPEMDGYECMRRIRELPFARELPIIALTAKAMKGDREKCLESGASDYLTKPIDMDKLLNTMRGWLS